MTETSRSEKRPVVKTSSFLLLTELQKLARSVQIVRVVRIFSPDMSGFEPQGLSSILKATVLFILLVVTVVGNSLIVHVGKF